MKEKMECALNANMMMKIIKTLVVYEEKWKSYAGGGCKIISSDRYFVDKIYEPK